MNRAVGLAVALVAAPLLMAQQLPVPSDVSARFTNMSPPLVDVHWRAPFGPWFYTVYRSAGDTLAFQRIGISGGTGFHDFAVAPQTTYYYRVSSAAYVDSLLVESPRSATVSIFTGGFGGQRGTVAGTVTADANGRPIAQVRVRFFRVGRNNYPVTTAYTNQTGQYATPLDTGVYIVKAEPSWEGGGSPGYRSEWHLNASEPSQATPVSVGYNTTVPLNFALAGSSPEQRVSVAGTVATSQGTPLASATVVVLRSLQEMNSIASTTGTTPGLGIEAGYIPGVGYTRGILWKGTTNMQGQFIAQVPAGRPFIMMAVRQGYRPEFAVNKPDPTEADIFVVVRDTAGIAFSLDPLPATPNVIQGIVRDSLGETVPSRVILFPRPLGTSSSPVRFVHTDTTGTYRVDNLASGSYLIQAVPFSGFAPAYFRAGSFGVVNWQQADSVPAGGVVSGVALGVVSVESEGLARVSGSLRGSSNAPIVGGSLVAYGVAGTVAGYGITEANGGYAIDAVVTGPVSIVVTRGGYTVAQTSVTIPPNTYSLPNVNFTIGPANPTGVREAGGVPLRTALLQNYPNPFNPTTRITYATATPGRVHLAVYDMLGRETAVLVDEERGAGEHAAEFDARGLAAGVYYCRLTAAGVTATRSMLLVK